jgi:hypothetical protein
VESKDAHRRADRGHAADGRIGRIVSRARCDWQPAVLEGQGITSRNRLSELRMAGLIEYRSDTITLTPAGNGVAPQPDLGVSLIESIRAALNGPQCEVLNALLELGLGDPAVAL